MRLRLIEMQHTQRFLKPDLFKSKANNNQEDDDGDGSCRSHGNYKEQ